MQDLYTAAMQFLNLTLPSVSQLPEACKELELETAFFAPMHDVILKKVNVGSPVFPHIDFESLKGEIRLILNLLNESHT
jgi:hypothetical protein